jgi:2-polyprenyl-6-hydroxyphenyl methylase/3-demethylubiquinone-9 3-methyltransferase
MKYAGGIMSVAGYVRKALGPLERHIADFYRGLFFDRIKFVNYIKSSMPALRDAHILDLGCGDGGITSFLAAAFPDAHITGTDVSQDVGRFYRGSLSNVVFEKKAINDIAAQTPSTFDIVVISDVMHHLPAKNHKEFLIQTQKILKPGGHIIIKDWEKDRSLIYFLAYFSDRYISGKKVYFRTSDGWKRFIIDTFGIDVIKNESWIEPWGNNLVFIIQP